LAKLAHPNVVPIHFIGQDGGHHFFAMQFIEGESLGQRLARQRRLPLEQATPIVEQCLAGLEAAHAQGLVHRDVKPGNVLLDRRSDIYSLGVMFYQLLAGSLPFAADTPTAMIFQHAYEEQFPLTKAAPDVPQPMVEIIARMMAKDPAQRYGSCAAVLADLRAFREGRPVEDAGRIGHPSGEEADLLDGFAASATCSRPACRQPTSGGSLMAAARLPQAAARP